MLILSFTTDMQLRAATGRPEDIFVRPFNPVSSPDPEPVAGPVSFAGDHRGAAFFYCADQGAISPPFALVRAAGLGKPDHDRPVHSFSGACCRGLARFPKLTADGRPGGRRPAWPVADPLLRGRRRHGQIRPDGLQAQSGADCLRGSSSSFSQPRARLRSRCIVRRERPVISANSAAE